MLLSGATNETLSRFNLPARKATVWQSVMDEAIRKSRAAGKQLTADQLYEIGIALDAIQPDITTPSVGTPIQFLQEWVPGFIHILTQARNIDKFIGMRMVGSWEMEQVIHSFMELVGNAQPYGDYTNLNFESWNVNFLPRTVVRFEVGMMVSLLEAERASKMNVDTAAEKRNSAALALEIQRNAVGFYGYNSGNNNTYGLLNDPNNPGYNTVPNGASGSSTWASKTFNEVTNDIISFGEALRVQSGDNIDPYETPITMGLATSVVDQLSKQNALGSQSVKQWLAETYPNWRVVSAPELNGANGGANVGYIYADRINDDSTDGGDTWTQMVQIKFRVTGVRQDVKDYKEGYTNATAGVFLKRPYALYRASGL